MHELPFDVLWGIIGHLTSSEVDVLCFVSKHFYESLSTPIVWQFLFKRDFCWDWKRIDSNFKENNSTLNWRQLYYVQQREQATNFVNFPLSPYFQLIQINGITNQSSLLPSREDIKEQIIQLMINPLLYSEKRKEKKTKNIILITGAPGLGKSFLLKCISQNNLFINPLTQQKITFFEIICYSIRSISADYLNKSLNNLYHYRPVILIIQEMESLSRRENENQNILYNFIISNTIEKTGIGFICVSQSPDRFPGQFPVGKWSSLLLQPIDNQNINNNNNNNNNNNHDNIIVYNDNNDDKNCIRFELPLLTMIDRFILFQKINNSNGVVTELATEREISRIASVTGGLTPSEITVIILGIHVEIMKRSVMGEKNANSLSNNPEINKLLEEIIDRNISESSYEELFPLLQNNK